jgi:hypothetical protein
MIELNIVKLCSKMLLLRVSSVIPRKRTMTTTDEDPILKQTVGTLQNLQDTLNQPPAQLANRAFSDYIFTELNKIDDEEIIADVKHAINNILYT